MELFERQFILSALDHNDWNRLRTVDEIGIPRTMSPPKDNVGRSLK